MIKTEIIDNIVYMHLNDQPCCGLKLAILNDWCEYDNVCNTLSAWTNTDTVYPSMQTLQGVILVHPAIFIDLKSGESFRMAEMKITFHKAETSQMEHEAEKYLTEYQQDVLEMIQSMNLFTKD